MEAIIYLALIFSFLLGLKLLFSSKGGGLRPPGPWPLPVIGNLHLLKNPAHQSVAKLSERYGPVLSLRFGSRPVVVVSSPAVVEECLSKNDVALAHRPRLLFGKHLGYDYSMMGWAPYGPQWRSLRRVANTELFNPNRLNDYAAVRAPEIRTVVKELFQEAAGEVNLRSKFTDLASNWTVEMICGKRYYGKGVAESEEAKEFLELTRELIDIGFKPVIGDFIPIFKWIDVQGAQKRMKNLAEKRDAFLQRLIDERRSQGVGEAEEHRALITALLALQKVDPDFCTDLTIKGMMEALLSAGTDSVYFTLEWAMAYLLNYPEAMRKVKDELDLQIGPDRMIQESDLPKLTYLQCIFNETLRLCPPAPLSVPHEASEDCTIGGFTVPRGTMIMTSIWAIQRDPTLWEDPLSFKPERFLGAEGEKETGFKWIPFGYGRRICPGSGLATRQIQLGLGALLHCFDWERAGAEKVDLTEGVGMTMPKAIPLVAKYRPREVMINLLSQL